MICLCNFTPLRVSASSFFFFQTSFGASHLSSLYSVCLINFLWFFPFILIIFVCLFVFLLGVLFFISKFSLHFFSSFLCHYRKQFKGENHIFVLCQCACVFDLQEMAFSCVFLTPNITYLLKMFILNSENH